jgi:hypothetical protein
MPLRDWTRQLIGRLVHDTKLADDEPVFSAAQFFDAQ